MVSFVSVARRKGKSVINGLPILLGCLLAILFVICITNPILADDETTDLTQKYSQWERDWNSDDTPDARSELVRDVMNFPKLLDERTRVLKQPLREAAFSTFFLEARKYLRWEDWCYLYSKYRGKGSLFEGAKFGSWREVDEHHEATCKKRLGKSGIKECPPGSKKIGDFFDKRKHKLELVGNGKDTATELLIFTNRKDGKSSVALLRTVCISTQNHKPPPHRDVGANQGLEYTPVVAPKNIIEIAKAATRLNKQGAYEKLRMPNASTQVRQLAIWKTIGEKSSRPQDKVTSTSVKKGIVKKANVELTPELDKALSNRVDQILASVNLTIKESRTPSDTPKKPKDKDSTSVPGGLGTKKPVQPKKPDGTSGGEKICIPPYTVFKPNRKEYQKMMTIEECSTNQPGYGETISDGVNKSDTIAKGDTSGDNSKVGAGNVSDVPGGGTTVTDQPVEEKPKKELGIALKRDDDRWIPENESTTSVTATIYEKDPTTGQWIPSSEKRFITFRFEQCSKEKGICLNSGNSVEPDLRFGKEGNPRLECMYAKTGGFSLRAITRKKVNQETAVIECVDYGAFSSLEATAPDCVSLKYLEKKAIGPVSDRSARIKVPKDDNDNKIADEYERQCNYAPKADEDKDLVPKGNGFKGDGLSAYEEYRGFMVITAGGKGQRNHRRTSWIRKDLFVRDKLRYGVGLFPQASGINTHFVDQSGHSAKRVVNYNHGFANLVEQHCVIIDRAVLDRGIGGSTDSSIINTLLGNLGPPKNVEQISVDVFQSGGGELVNVRWVEETVAHELGHAVCIHHHGTGSWKNELIYPSTYSNQMLSRNTHPSPTLGKTPLPAKFWIGTKGNQSSGVEDCLMRYWNKGGGVYPSEKVGGFEFSGEKYPFQTIFCNTKFGSSFNANNRGAGDATLGNCASQIVVSDLYD